MIQIGLALPAIMAAPGTIAVHSHDWPERTAKRRRAAICGIPDNENVRDSTIPPATEFATFYPKRCPRFV